MNNKLVIFSSRNLQKADVITTSKIISEVFEKRHDHVIRDIEKILENIEKLGYPNLGSENPCIFTKVEYTLKGRKYPMYNLNRDATILLIMGYEKELAFKLKIEYIKEFNKMENELKQIKDARIGSVVNRNLLTDSIKDFVTDNIVPYNKYAYITNTMYARMFGKTAKQLREQYGVKTNDLLRDYLDKDKLKDIQKLEIKVGVFLEYMNPLDAINKVFDKYELDNE